MITNSVLETKKIGNNLAHQVLKSKPSKQAIVIGLVGELGGGKTSFVQGFAKGLGVKEKILSPTFVIMKRFVIQNLRFTNLYHFDCYRIEKPSELLELGFKKIIQNPNNIVIIEWAGRIKRIIPKNATWINFDFIDEKKRKIIISSK